jgi:hypothetical protein
MVYLAERAGVHNETGPNDTPASAYKKTMLLFPNLDYDSFDQIVLKGLF